MQLNTDTKVYVLEGQQTEIVVSGVVGNDVLGSFKRVGQATECVCDGRSWVEWVGERERVSE
jgi:hypothetical protein